MTKSWNLLKTLRKRTKFTEEPQASAPKSTSAQYSTATANVARSTVTTAVASSVVISPPPTLPMSVIALSTAPSPQHKPISPPTVPLTTVRKPSALDIPEILIKIGHAIPQFSSYFTARYSPKQILRCTRVSRLWYNVMMPLVWHSFDDSVMNTVPAHVLKQNANWIRVLNHQHNFGGQTSPFVACQNLVQLTLSPWVGGVDKLIKSNKRLTKSIAKA
ncbi:hypothetical protein BGZ81_010063 [Podila clonocystis]|nr:hypothetical protein BGZ81_010063 [Podila clonocystis]